MIISGGVIQDYQKIRSFLQEGDYVIAADRGLYHAQKMGVTPHLIVGDFDSHPLPDTDTDTIVLPCEKDDTDTVSAIRQGLSRGYTSFLLLGCTGGRTDHALGNLYSLLMIKKCGGVGVLADEYCKMQFVDKCAWVDESYPYFSLIAMCGPAAGITVKNAKYPLNNGVITPQYQYGISNEVLPGKRAYIEVKEGELLLIQSES